MDSNISQSNIHRLLVDIEDKLESIIKLMDKPEFKKMFGGKNVDKKNDK